MATYAQQVVADGATAYWKLGEPSGTTAVDSVGAKNGAISGGVTLGQPGPLADGSTAMAFNGTTGQIVPSGSVTLAAAVTLEAWIKTTNVDNGFHTIFSARPVASGALLSMSGQRLSIYVDATQVSGVGLLTSGAWRHIAVVLTGAAATLYLDGAVDATGPIVHSATTSAVTIAFEPSLFWDGLLAHVAIYPSVLSPAQIANHYALRLATAGPAFATGPIPWGVFAAGDEDLMVRAYNDWKPITTSNTIDLPAVTQAIWVGGTGDVAAVLQNNVMPVVLAAVPAGAWLPLAVRRINATGTTATGIIALYTV